MNKKNECFPLLSRAKSKQTNTMSLYHAVKSTTLWLVSLLLTSQLCHGALQIKQLKTIKIDRWSTIGNTEDLIGFDDFCVISHLKIDKVKTAYGYHASLIDNNGNSDFTIVNGNNTLPLRLDVQQNSGAWQNFPKSGDELRYFKGALNCSEANSQLRLQATVAANDMQQAVPGIYSGSFSYAVEQTSESDTTPVVDPGWWEWILEILRQAGETTTKTKSMRFSVEVPELIQLTGLPNNIDFGLLTPLNNASQNADFCVYRNGLNGNFKLTASGDGAGNAFMLGNALPYRIFFGQNGSYNELTTPGDFTQIVGLTGHNRRNCNNSTNTQLRIDISSADLSNTATGNYTGVLTITVAPE